LFVWFVFLAEFLNQSTQLTTGSNKQLNVSVSQLSQQQEQQQPEAAQASTNQTAATMNATEIKNPSFVLGNDTKILVSFFVRFVMVWLVLLVFI
jgi:hypothetical protein